MFLEMTVVYWLVRCITTIRGMGNLGMLRTQVAGGTVFVSIVSVSYDNK